MFISHALKDKAVVDALVDLLTECGIAPKDIFCTSVESLGITTGQKFIEEVAQRLRESDLVVLMLTPNYYASSFCIAEMGGSWALDLLVFPFVFAGVPRDPGVVFSKTQSQSLDGPGLDALHEVLLARNLMEEALTGRWNVKKQELLDGLPGLLAGLPAPDVVRRAEYDGLAKTVEAARQMLSEEKAKRKALEQQYEALRGLKDAEQVREMERKNLPIFQQYEEAVKAARGELGQVDRVVERCVYALIADSPWSPANWEASSSEIQAALERGQIRYVGEHESVLVADLDDPSIGRAVGALNDVEALLSADEKCVLIVPLGRKHDCKVSVFNRAFFEKAIVRRKLLD